MPRQQGFTLIELLVAIAIFALLSALSWQIFDYLVKSRDSNQRHEAAVAQLQDAYQQIQRDSVQALPLRAQIGENLQPALVLQNGRFNFSKGGVADPMQLGRSPEERIEYQYNLDEKALYRLQYPQLHHSGQLQPLRSVLMRDLEDWQVQVLNPEPMNNWPEQETQHQQLPRGFQVQFKYQDIQYQWIFSLLNTAVIGSGS